MELPYALSIQRSGTKQLTDEGNSVALSSYLPVHPTSLEKKYHQLAFSQQVSFERELMMDSLVPHSSFLASTSVPFISQFLNGGTTVSSTQSSHSELFESTEMSNYTKENCNVSWCEDSPQGFLYLPDNVPVENRQLESTGTGGVTTVDHMNRSDWHLGDQLITDVAPYSNWSEIFALTNANDEQMPALHELKESSNSSLHQPQDHQQLPVDSGESNPVGGPTSSSNCTSTKPPRMRWSSELHQCFIEAVNKLGGSERATPKTALKLMKVEGLTIHQVKSHLQKYRTARYEPESSKGNLDKKATAVEDISSLDLKARGFDFTEALRMQMEVQKQLHEQLESQKNLQLRLEEQGRNIQKMIEEQYKTSTMDDPFAPPASLMQHSPSTVEVNDNAEVGKDILDSNATLGQSFSMGGQKAFDDDEATEDIELDATERSH